MTPGRVAVAGIAASVVCAGAALLHPSAAFPFVAAALMVLVATVVVLVRRTRRDQERIDDLTALESKRADQVAMLSHEVRTPLAVILGSAELLSEPSAGVLTPRQGVFVKRIIDNANRMSVLAEQLLIRARIEAGMFTLTRAPVDLRRLLRDVADDLAPTLSATIMVDAPGAPFLVQADAILIRQVVTNLVTNASRSDPDSGRIELRLQQGEDEVLVSVSDGGQGMTDHQRDRLFERFSSGRPLGNGTGIGLYLSQQLVALHGGRLYVDTITGRGTTVLFTLPLSTRHGKATSRLRHR